jgi:hypothetical protein
VDIKINNIFCYLKVIAIVGIPSGTLKPKEIASGIWWMVFLVNWTFSVSQISKLSVQLFIPVLDKPERFRIVLVRIISCQFYFSIREYVLGKSTTPFNTLILEVLLGPDHKERV